MFSSFDYFSRPPTQRTVYVVSDAQLNNLKLKQRQEELDSISDQRKSLDNAYQASVKALDGRENALQADLKALAPSEAKEKVAAECLQSFQWGAFSPDFSKPTKVVLAGWI